MTRLPFVVLSGAIVLALAGSNASAQDPAPPAHVEYVDGRAVLEHDTTSEEVEPNLPLDTGDRLRTERGRVEVLFGDGSLLQLDEDTTIDVLSDSLIRELTGRVAIVAGSARAGRLQVDTPAGSVRVTSAGEFRVSVFEQGGAPEIELAVIRGSADLFTDQGTISVGAGARALARQGEAPSEPMSFNSAHWDAFDRWSQDRLSLRRGVASYQHVPPPLSPYGAVLDNYGSWNYEPTYGYVWFPRVAHGWRPYYQGRWRFYARFGWTWVGGDVWAWPTHHYGRWGLTSAGGWFWVPGRTWGPAWVHWAVAPGYVSWCPLGFDGRPVAPFGYGYASRSYGRDPWNAWTVVRRDHFGGHGSVTRLALDGRRFGPDGVRPFVLQPTAPARPYAVARTDGSMRSRDGSGVPSRPGAIGVAVPRGTSAAGSGQAAASREWGRDLRWSNQQAPDRPTAVRRGSPDPATGATGAAVQPWRRNDAVPGSTVRDPARTGHYGGAVGRRAPGDPAVMPRTATPRAPAPPAWNPDSVPVYRGGALTPLSDVHGSPRRYDGAAGASRRSGYPAMPSVSSDGPRAVPRGAAPSYVPAPGYPPPSYPQRTYQQPPQRAPSAPSYGPPPSGGPSYRERPAPSSAAPAPPTGPGRQGPGRGGAETAVPRGGAQPRGGGEQPPARSSGGNGHHSRRG